MSVRSQTLVSKLFSRRHASSSGRCRARGHSSAHMRARGDLTSEQVRERSHPSLTARHARARRRRVAGGGEGCAGVGHEAGTLRVDDRQSECGGVLVDSSEADSAVSQLFSRRDANFRRRGGTCEHSRAYMDRRGDLTSKQVCELLTLTPAALYAHIRRGHIRCYRVGRSLRFRREDVDALRTSDALAEGRELLGAQPDNDAKDGAGTRGGSVRAAPTPASPAGGAPERPRGRRRSCGPGTVAAWFDATVAELGSVGDESRARAASPAGRVDGRVVRHGSC
jgi:excisionase family DNA binding protein